MTMKLKLDENNNVVVKDGMPVYVHADGKEIPFDANKATVKIAELNGEAKQHREAKEAVEAKLKAFEGIADPKAAIKALETVKNLDDKKLIDAGEVEKVKAEMRKTFDAAEHLNLPSDVVQAFFGKHFSISDEGKVVAKFADGNEIYSRSRPGEKADFEEALEALVGAYPNKDAILKPSGTSGSGAGTGTGGGNAPKSLAECKTDAEKIAYMQQHS